MPSGPIIDVLTSLHSTKICVYCIIDTEAKVEIVQATTPISIKTYICTYFIIGSKKVIQYKLIMRSERKLTLSLSHTHTQIHTLCFKHMVTGFGAWIILINSLTSKSLKPVTIKPQLSKLSNYILLKLHIWHKWPLITQRVHVQQGLSNRVCPSVSVCVCLSVR